MLKLIPAHTAPYHLFILHILKLTYITKQLYNSSAIISSVLVDQYTHTNVSQVVLGRY